MGELTASQRHFVNEFVANRNATKAYLRAFPQSTYATARTMSSKLIANANISREIAAAIQSHARDCSITARKVLRELAAIAFADPEDAFTEDASGLPVPRKWSAVSPSAKRAIRSVKVKKRVIQSDEHFLEEIIEVEYKFNDKLKALDQLAKYLGLFKESDALAQLLGLLEASACGPPAGE